MKLTAAVLSGTSSPFVENIHAPFNLGTHYQHGRASPNEMNHAWNTKDNMFILAALGTDRSDWLKLANNRQYVSSVCSAIPSICQKFPDKSVEFISEHIRRLAEHRFRREWTSDDDDLLRTLHLQHSNSLSYWGVIGVELKRGKDQCRNRWTQIKKTGASMTGPFSPNEIDTLLTLIRKQLGGLEGTPPSSWESGNLSVDWTAIEKGMPKPNRSGTIYNQKWHALLILDNKELEYDDDIAMLLMLQDIQNDQLVSKENINFAMYSKTFIFSSHKTKKLFEKLNFNPTVDFQVNVESAIQSLLHCADVIPESDVSKKRGAKKSNAPKAKKARVNG